ncbi:MAG: type 4a pilus biogenesis protein PilO [Fimbriimonadaceae bacterium]
MKKPNPKPFLIMMLLTVVVSAGLCYMQYQNYTEVSNEVTRLAQEKKDPEQVKAEVIEAESKLEQSKLQLAHLEQGVPELAYVPTLLKELEKAGKDAGVEVLGIRPVPRATPAPKKGESLKAKSKPYTELDIQVGCRGDYKSAMNFLKALQMFPKILAARTISMQPKSGQKDPASVGNAPQLDVQFELRAYLFATDGEAKKETKEEAPAEKTINISGRNKAVTN